MPVSSLDFEETLDEEEVQVEEPVQQPKRDAAMVEASFAAQLLARPDYLPAVAPEPRDLSDPVVRAMLHVVQTRGPAYAKPGTMLAALESLTYTVDDER